MVERPLRVGPLQVPPLPLHRRGAASPATRSRQSDLHAPPEAQIKQKETKKNEVNPSPEARPRGAGTTSRLPPQQPPRKRGPQRTATRRLAERSRSCGGRSAVLLASSRAAGRRLGDDLGERRRRRRRRQERDGDLCVGVGVAVGWDPMPGRGGRRGGGLTAGWGILTRAVPALTGGAKVSRSTGQ